MGRPSFQYDPILQRETDGDLSRGITVMGVDILPAELPRESSAHFGDALSPVVKELLHAREQQSAHTTGIDTGLLSPGLVRFPHFAILELSRELFSPIHASRQPMDS